MVNFRVGRWGCIFRPLCLIFVVVIIKITDRIVLEITADKNIRAGTRIGVGDIEKCERKKAKF